MAEYLWPGVYVEEVAEGARPIQAIGTSIAAFVGEAPSADARANEPVAVRNWTDFCARFAAGSAGGTALSRAVYGFFDNGGGYCYVVNVGHDRPISGNGTGRAGLDCLEEIDGISLVAAPGRTDVADYEAIIAHAEKMQDRFAILDGPQAFDDAVALTEVATLGAAAGEDRGANDAKASGEKGRGLRPRNSEYAAFYYPWIYCRDPLDAKSVVAQPPSGHLAGIYARGDRLRGVHKAPANEPIRGCLGLTYRLTREEQGLLNPKGVNCLRHFRDAGVLVWGARTLADASSESRYINVKRTMMMIRESISEGTRWTVFEPNDRTLWNTIKREIGSFLRGLWREGALMGATPEQAYFVKCDEETNPADSIAAGRVVAVIGVALVRPAEFVIFRISQWVGGEQGETAATLGEGA